MKATGTIFADVYLLQIYLQGYIRLFGSNCVKTNLAVLVQAKGTQLVVLN